MANIFCKFGAHGIVDVNNGVGKTKEGCQFVNIKIKRVIRKKTRLSRK
jgi:hypothetical protein